METPTFTWRDQKTIVKFEKEDGEVNRGNIGLFPYCGAGMKRAFEKLLLRLLPVVIGSCGRAGRTCSVIDRQIREDGKLRRHIEQIRQMASSRSIERMTPLLCIRFSFNDLALRG